MSRKSMRIAAALLLYLPLGLCGADALAGAVFTLANKQMPEDLSLRSWPGAGSVFAITLNLATRPACSRITRALSVSGLPPGSPRNFMVGFDQNG